MFHYRFLGNDLIEIVSAFLPDSVAKSGAYCLLIMSVLYILMRLEWSRVNPVLNSKQIAFLNKSRLFYSTHIAQYKKGKSR